MENIELIVLGTTRVGESAVVVHTLSREYGRRGFIVRSGKKAGMAHFLPLNIIEARVYENPKSELWTLSGIVLRDGLSGIRSRVQKNTVSLFLSEVLFRTLRDGANEDGLFDWCVGSILAFDALEADYANFHLRFLLEFAGALGFRPSVEDIGPFCGPVQPQMKALLQSDFSGCMLLPLTGAQRNALCDALLQYLSYHTEQTISIRSLPVLHSLFAGL